MAVIHQDFFSLDIKYIGNPLDCQGENQPLVNLIPVKGVPLLF
jgi:hypothetical protein